MIGRVTQLGLTKLIKSPLGLGLGTATIHPKWYPSSLGKGRCRLWYQTQPTYTCGGFSKSRLVSYQASQPELSFKQTETLIEESLVEVPGGSLCTREFQAGFDGKSVSNEGGTTETNSAEEAAFRREILQHYETFTACTDFKPVLDEDISTLPYTVEIDALIQSGDVETCCERFMYLLKNHLELQIPSEHVVLLLQHIIQSQANLASTDFESQAQGNLFQTLLEKGLLSNRSYSDLKVKNEMIAGLDILMDLPRVFSKWNHFDSSTKQWISYTFLFRPEHTTETILSHFLAGVSPKDLYNGYKLALSSLCEFPNIRVSVSLNLKLLREMKHKEMDVNSHICYATLSKILKSQQLTRIHFDSVWFLIKTTNNLDEHFLSYAYQNLINFLNIETSITKNKHTRYLLLEIFDSMSQRRIAQPASCYNMVLKHLVYLSQETSNDASHLANNPVYELSDMTPKDTTFKLPGLDCWYYSQMKKVFQHMLAMQIPLDSYTLNAFILYFIFSNRPRQPISSEILESCYKTLISAGAAPDQLTFNYLLHFYGKCGNTASMKKVVTRMISNKIYPNSQTLQELVSVLTEKQDFRSALQFFEKITTSSELNEFGKVPPVTPSLETCVAMFSVCQKIRDVVFLDRLWDVCRFHQQSSSLKLPQNTYHQVILAYSRLLHTYTSGSPKYPADPDLVLERIQTIAYLLNLDYPDQIQVSVYNVLLKGYTLYLLTPRGRQNWMSSYDLIKQVLVNMINSSLSKPNLISYNTVLSCLPLVIKSAAQADYFKVEVNHLRESMRDLNLKPDVNIATSLLKIYGVFGRDDLVEITFQDFLQSQSKSKVNSPPNQLCVLYNLYLQCQKFTDPAVYSKMLDNMKVRNILPTKETFQIIFNKFYRFKDASFDCLVDILDKTSYLSAESKMVDFQFLCSLGDALSKFGGRGLLYGFDFMFNHFNCSLFEPKEYSLIVILLLKPTKTDLRQIPQTLNLVKVCLVNILTFPASQVDPSVYKKLMDSLEFSYKSHQSHWHRDNELLQAFEDLKRRSTNPWFVKHLQS